MSRAWLVVWCWCWLGWVAEPASGADAAQRENDRHHVERNPSGAEVRRVRFQIPQTTAKDALVLFAQQAQTPLLVSFEMVATVQANSLVGEFSLAEGLDRLLAGSGLQGNVNEQGVINVTQATSAGKKPESGASTKEEPAMRETPSRGILARIALAFTALVAGPGQASAEDAEAPSEEADQRILEEVIVTATKRSDQRLLDVPLSLQLLEESTLIDSSLRDIGELISFVPGASEGLSLAVGQRYFQIRGLYPAAGSPMVG